MIVACGHAGTQSLILDPTTGSLKVVAGVSGSDALAYDPARNVAFETAQDAGGPVLAVFDGSTGLFTQGLSSTFATHSVAADPVSGEVFAAFNATGQFGPDPLCPAGCIAVFAPVAVPEPPAAPMMVLSLAGLGLLVARRRAW